VYAWNWPETAGADVTPPGEHGLYGYPEVGVVPVDYCDLATIDQLRVWDPAWEPVLDACAKFLLAAEIQDAGAPSGRFWNSYLGDTHQYSGDFENRDDARAGMLLSIQQLWTALHLARYGLGGGTATQAGVRVTRPASERPVAAPRRSTAR